MKSVTLPFLSTSLRRCFIFATLLAGAGFSAQAQFSDTSRFWSDPEFVERFMGSYGYLSGAEPKINESEIELFKENLELIQANPKAAAARLSQAVNGSSSAVLEFLLGNLYFQNGDTERAQEFYKKAIKKFPDYRRAYKNLSLLSVQSGNLTEAITYISKSIELGERDGKLYGLLGYAYLDQENYLAAEQAYRQAILLEPAKKDWKIGLARCLLEIEQFEEADTLFKTLIAESPDKADYWMLQANTYLGRNQPLRAAANLEIVKKMGQAKKESLVLLGDIYMNAGMPELAAEAYLEVIAIDTNRKNSTAAIRAADVLTGYGANDKAREVIAQIRSAYSSQLSEADDLKILTLSARIERADGNADKAAETLESIVARDPLNGDALMELARYYKDKKEYAKAVDRVEHAANTKDFEFDALVLHAQILVAQQKYKEAVPLLKEALGIRDDARIGRYLEKIERASKVVVAKK